MGAPDQEGANATEHDPAGIAYLCGSCHDRVTRGFWSRERVAEARGDPWCLRSGHCHDAFDVSGPVTTVWLGPVEVVNVATILAVDGEPILQIHLDSPEPGPFEISARFFDDRDDLLFAIERNEWIGDVRNWDIECSGGHIIIRRDLGKIALKLMANPPSGVIIKRADLQYRGVRLNVSPHELLFTGPDDSAFRFDGHRSVQGLGEGSVLLSGWSDGGVVLGPGPLRL